MTERAARERLDTFGMHAFGENAGEIAVDELNVGERSCHGGPHREGL
jgi:hypothetical protein